MNILPKKRWHVRTKENVARVRRDEAKAAEEERQRKERAKLAEQEFRTKSLRDRAAARKSAQGVLPSFEQPSENTTDERGHINFFADLESEELKKTVGGNEEHEKEKKLEKEAEERKIGLLKYLGEGSHEYMKELPWYQKIPDREQQKTKKSTTRTDLPVFVTKMQTVPAVAVDTPSKSSKSRKRKHKKHKKHKRKRSRSGLSSDSNPDASNDRPDLDRLRAERLRRESAEKIRTEQLLRKARGEAEPAAKPEPKRQRQQYSSQFNPDLARQNM